MERKKFTQQEIEKTLQSIDGISKAEAPSFFYTHLQAKMDKQNVASNSIWSLITKPAVSLVTLSLLIIVNLAAIRSYLTTPTKTVSITTPGIEKFAEEYGLNSSSAYTDKTPDNELLQQK